MYIFKKTKKLSGNEKLGQKLIIKKNLMICFIGGFIMSKNKSYLVNLLCKLIEIESPTCCENNIAKIIAETMNDIGFDEICTDNNFNVVGDLKASNNGKTLLFLNHSDTSPIYPEQKPLKAELIKTDNFGKKEMIIRGLGTVAPKAGIAAMLDATRRLSERRHDWKGCVKVAVVTKGLNANHDGPREVSHLIKDIDFAITDEPSNNNVVIATRGIIRIKVTIYGESTHYAIPKIKSNVFYKLGKFLENLKDIPIIQDNDFGLTGFNPINLDLKETSPLLPKWINLIIDRRVLPDESTEEIIDQIDSIKKKMGEDKIKIEIIRKMYPFKAKDVNQEKKIFKNVISTTTGKEPKEIAIHCGTNAGFLTTELNVRSLVIGPGNLENIGLNENVKVESLKNASDIYYGFALKYLC